jgi:hypothetical protein
MKSVSKCNVLEEDENELLIEDGHNVKLDYMPFQILTVKINFGLEKNHGQ